MCGEEDLDQRGAKNDLIKVFAANLSSQTQTPRVSRQRSQQEAAPIQPITTFAKNTLVTGVLLQMH